MMSRGVCSRSQGHSTRSTSTMRLSDTSSWPSRASSKAAPGGTVTSVRALDCARAEPAVPRRSSRARRGPCGPASSATRSRSSPSSPAGTKTAPPPASARSEAAGARPAAAPMYTSVRLTALPRGPCERASSARRRRGRARGSRRAVGAWGSGERLGVEAGRVLDVDLLLGGGEPGLPGLRLQLGLESLLDHRLGFREGLRGTRGLLGDLDDVIPELRLDRRRDGAGLDAERDLLELGDHAALGEAAEAAALVLGPRVDGVLLGDLVPVRVAVVCGQQSLDLLGLALGVDQHMTRLNRIRHHELRLVLGIVVVRLDLLRGDLGVVADFGAHGILQHLGLELRLELLHGHALLLQQRVELLLAADLLGDLLDALVELLLRDGDVHAGRLLLDDLVLHQVVDDARFELVVLRRALFGERGSPLLGPVLGLRLGPDLVELPLRDTGAADRRDGPGRDLVAAAGGEHERRRKQAEQDRSHDDFLHRLSLPGIVDWSRDTRVSSIASRVASTHIKRCESEFSRCALRARRCLK